MAEPPSLSRRAAHSVIWTVVRFGGDQLFNFLVYATLARLLRPAEFGIFIVSLAVAEFGKILAQGGLVASLYRAPEITPRLADTVFWANVVMGLFVAALSFMLRHPLAAALGSPGSAPIIGVVGLVVPISAAGASHMSRHLRNFGHRALAVRSLFSGLVGGGLGLAAAFAGWGVWALVVQRFTAETIGTVVAWRAFRWKPGFDVSLRTLREQLGLGISVATASAMLVALSRTQDIIISRIIGLASVGIYRTAWKSIEVIAQGVVVPFSSVAEPTLLRLRHDPAVFRRGYLRIVGASAIVSFPAIVGMGAMADQLIPLLYGPQWRASVPIAQILTFLVMPFALNFFAEPTLTVLGQAQITMYLSFAQLGLSLLFCILAAPYGLVTFAIAYVSRSYITMGLQLFLVGRATDTPPLMVVGAVIRPVAAAAGMAALLATLRFIIPAEPDPTALHRVVRAALFIAAGVASYAAILFVLLGRTARDDLLRTARGIIGRRPLPA